MKARILVVDDEPHTRRLVSLQLEREGYEVATARNGEEALERLRAESFDAVVTDYSMPRMDGRALCEEIRRDIGESVPLIVLMTSQVSEEVGDWVSSLRNARYFEKPFSLRRLTRLLESDLEQEARA